MRVTLTFFLFCCCINLGLAQFDGLIEVPDSLIAKSYHDLYRRYYENYDSLPLSEPYSIAFIKKAYIEKDSLNILTGYFMITYGGSDKYISFNDSLLKYASFMPKKERVYFSWHAHDEWGGYYYDKRNFKLAFDHFYKSLEYAEEGNLKEYYNNSRTHLGLLKERTGKHEEALGDFRKNVEFEINKYEQLDSITRSDIESLLHSFCLLGNSYRFNNKLDSAQLMNKKVFNYNKFPGSESFLGDAGLNSSEVHYDLKEYEAVIDSVDNALPFLINDNNTANVAVAYYLRGMSRVKIYGADSGVEDLKKMDSVCEIVNDLYPPLRSGYSFLVDYYKDRKEISKQLYYVNQLLKFDSLVYDYNQHIKDGIYKKMDRQVLLDTQEELKEQVSEIEGTKELFLWGGSTIIVLLLLELVRRRKRNRRLIKEYQKRFDTLLQQKEIDKETADSIDLEDENNVQINIAQPVIIDILENLKTFEDNRGYLDGDITASKLAKEIGTNANYLGRVIRYNFRTNFRQYINDLRMEFILKKLRNDRKLLNYSIAALAREAGYNHAEPFSKTFKIKTGVYPSEFIAQIKEGVNTHI